MDICTSGVGEGVNCWLIICGDGRQELTRLATTIHTAKIWKRWLRENMWMGGWDVFMLE
jgi:hypothetical protein